MTSYCFWKLTKQRRIHVTGTSFICWKVLNFEGNILLKNVFSARMPADYLLHIGSAASWRSSSLSYLAMYLCAGFILLKRRRGMLIFLGSHSCNAVSSKLIYEVLWLYYYIRKNWYYSVCGREFTVLEISHRKGYFSTENQHSWCRSWYTTKMQTTSKSKKDNIYAANRVTLCWKDVVEINSLRHSLLVWFILSRTVKLTDP